ncbi:MAG: hypothetical protein JWP59_2086 [Massilia sp.]|nr:hypothetical protein [Massilia sp.]
MALLRGAAADAALSEAARPALLVGRTEQLDTQPAWAV